MQNMKRDEAISTINAQYVCTFRPAEGGGYSVRCAAFPGLITDGETLEEARHNAREALELCIEVYLEKGWPLPPSEDDPRKTIKEMVPVKLARA
jgi:predicted RNase H-like HicB family nuclease